MPGHRDQFVSDFDEIRERLDAGEQLTLVERKLQEIEDALHIKPQKRNENIERSPLFGLLS